jgi:two-component system cell cycle sensor histidine kinase/response regulator CckA
MKKKGKSVKSEVSRPRSAPLRGLPSAIDLISYLIGSDRLLDLLLNNVSDLIVVLDRDGKRIYNSPSYRTVLGDPDTLRGTSAFGEIHPEDRANIQKVFRQTIRTGKGQKAEYRFLLPKGSVRHIESRGHIIRDAKGDIRYILVISRDITAQQVARKELDESEATFRGLVEHSLVGVYILQDGYFSYINPRIVDIIGYQPEEVVNKIRVTDMVVEADRERVEQNIRRRIEGETKSIWYSIQVRRKDGMVIDIEVSGAQTTYRGKPAIIGTLLEVTERKRSEALQLALYRITEKATSVTDLAEFYAALHAILGELMYAQNFYIALYDEQTKDLSFPYFVDEFDPPPPPQKLGRGLTEYVVRTARPLLATPEVFQQLIDRGEVVLLGGASVDWLGVPLLRGTTAFGVIVVQSYKESIRFGAKEQEILTYISRHIAVAIDRKRTEAALRESEVKHRTIIAGMADGIILHDARGMVTSFNPGALRILDLTPAEMSGWPATRRVFDPVHEDGNTFELVEHPAMVTLRTGNPCADVVMGFRTTGGHRHWVSINSQPLLRAGDELPYAVVVSLTDITRRKEAENALTRSELRFRSLVEAIPDWIWETDTEGRYTYASPRLKELLGYEPAEVLGKRPRDFMHPADAQRFSKQMIGTFSRGDAFSGVLNRHIRKDGRVVILETSAEPIIDDHGALRGYRGIDRDVTTRKEGEEELARLKMAVEQAAESILITEPDGTIVYVNPAFEQVSGFLKSEVIGNNPRILKSGIHDDGFYSAMWQNLQRGEVWSGHITNRRKDGSLVEEQMVISPVRDAGGRVVNYVAVKRDMTHEVEIERRLRQSQKMESLGQLAGGIAHDFNNVLGVIQGGLALLKTRLTDPALARYVDIGESAVNRGADVAKRLLTFSREGQVALRPLALADVVGELTKVLEHSIERTIDIVTEIPRNLPIIQGDPGQLYQMLLNLCLNARDAILESQPVAGTGRITISARTVGGDIVRRIFKSASAPLYVCISMSDTGIGMKEDIRSRVFEPFFTTKPTGKGTGLGLSVVYGIVQSHNGMIDVESVPRGGTTFRIYLQAYPEETAVRIETIAPKVSGGQETVLVVEDEEALRGLVSELLQSYGYNVLQAEDGMEGLALFDRHRGTIGAVITDMGLPRMSGKDMFARIRDIDPSARVILASGYLEPGLKSRLFNAGAKAFIQKPYKPHEVLRIVREVLDVQEQ